MLGNSPRSHLNTIKTATVSVGATLPKPVAAAIARAEKLSEAATRLHPGRDAVLAAVVRALDADRDPAADPDVQRAYIGSKLTGDADHLVTLIANDVYDQAATTCRQHADAIVAAWRKPFEAAAATLSAAHGIIGDLPLADTGSILAKGPDASTAWSEATKAERRIDVIVTAWTALAHLTRFAELNPRFPALRLADYTPEQWDGSTDRQNLTAWQVLLTGGRLDLPDGAEHARRVLAIVRAEQQAHEARQQKGVRDMRSSGAYIG